MMIRARTVQIPHPTACIQPAFSPDGGYEDPEWDDLEIPVDAFSCDEFRMLEFKVKRCARARSHDWTECPYAHPGEKARRRDPRKYGYSGSSCPDYRKGGCRKGDACEYAHGVFESWLHPDRYRTQPCKDGTHCLRRVCFFAHTPEQLRVIPGGYSSPPESPPVSPSEALRMSGLAQAMRNLQVARRLGFTIPTRPGPAAFDPPMERVESGRVLRERMYAKLSLDNFVDSGNSVPDFGWIAELVN